MRLDKYLTECTELSRMDAKKQIHKGEVTVNGNVVKTGNFKVAETDEVAWSDQVISQFGTRYIMLNKPEGFICSNVNEDYPSVLNLIDVTKVERLRIAGRLDVDTTGLVLLSEDGQWCHRITSPNKATGKCYQVELDRPITDEQVEQLTKGVMLKGEKVRTSPAEVEVLNEQEIILTLTEGKYHQVKRMLAAVGNHVLGLHRLSIAGIQLDENLAPGEWRVLTEDEIAMI